MTLAEPIRPPLPKRLCCLCESGYIGPCGVYCVEYHELIDDETVAQECEGWDPR